jgi:general secretion pathway protein F
MKFKITYQKNKNFKTVILEADNAESLKQNSAFPSNIIKIKKIQEFKFDIASYTNPKKEVYEFFTQLDMMLSANLTFSEAIDLLLDSRQEKRIEQVLKVIKHSLSTSVSIDNSLLKYKSFLGETSLLFLKLGFENGNIKESIHSLVEMLGEDIASRDKLNEVMRYPLILVTSLFISIGMIFIYVLPNFEFIFTLLKDEIPFSTYLLISIKDILDKYWILIFIGSGICLFISSLIIKKYRYIYDKILLLHIPIFSKMIQDYNFYRLFLSISIIVKSKYQFQIAISNSKNVVNNLYVQEMLNQVLINIKNGLSISESFDKSCLFDALTMKLLNTADSTNNYEYILSNITIQYKKRFHKSLKNFSSTIEPILILTISVVVLWLILAIMLPIWNLGAVIN